MSNVYLFPTPRQVARKAVQDYRVKQSQSFKPYLLASVLILSVAGVLGLAMVWWL
jgi:hypothetical protein